LSPCYSWAHALALRAPASWSARQAAVLWHRKQATKEELQNSVAMPRRAGRWLCTAIAHCQPLAVEQAVGQGVSAGVSGTRRAKLVAVKHLLYWPACSTWKRLPQPRPDRGKRQGRRGKAPPTPRLNTRPTMLLRQGRRMARRDWHNGQSAGEPQSGRAAVAAAFAFPSSYSHTPSSPPASALCRNSRHLRRGLQPSRIRGQARCRPAMRQARPPPASCSRRSWDVVLRLRPNQAGPARLLPFWFLS
jgi:hypothetical protein